MKKKLVLLAGPALLGAVLLVALTPVFAARAAGAEDEEGCPAIEINSKSLHATEGWGLILSGTIGGISQPVAFAVLWDGGEIPSSLSSLEQSGEKWVFTLLTEMPHDPGPGRHVIAVQIQTGDGCVYNIVWDTLDETWPFPQNDAAIDDGSSTAGSSPGGSSTTTAGALPRTGLPLAAGILALGGALSGMGILLVRTAGIKHQ